ncbi:MAG: hypothetical protein ACYDAJ_08270 [Nitrosotalea sp.]
MLQTPSLTGNEKPKRFNIDLAIFMEKNTCPSQRFLAEHHAKGANKSQTFHTLHKMMKTWGLGGY